MNEEQQLRDKYLRVTSVLYPFSNLQHINPEILARAAARGTKVHKICEAIVKGLGEIGVDEETWGYIESFKKWWETDIQVVMIEKRFWNDALRLTGQVDFIINTPEGLAVVDIKTSSRPSKTWQAQGNAYAYLASKAGHDIRKIFFLHLNKHGKKPKLIEYPVDHSFFLAIFRTFLHFYQEG